MTGIFPSVTLLAAAAAAAVQPSGASPGAAASAKTVWSLEWRESSCTVSMGSPDDLALSLWITPGSDAFRVYVLGNAARFPPRVGDTAKLKLVPSPEILDLQVETTSNRAGLRLVKFYGASRDFTSAFASVRQIEIAGNEGALSIPVKGSKKAAAALRSCADSKLAEWGFNLPAFHSLRTLPKLVEGRYFLRHTDYPNDALQAGRDGYLLVRLSTDVKGRVTDCAVLITSGMPSMDKATCSAALKRGQFAPATGADGRPAPAVFAQGVQFRIGN